VRVVLDTNVVVSALLWRGTPYRLLQFILQQNTIELYTSAVLLRELADVLGRPTTAHRLAVIGQAARDVFINYAASAELVAPAGTPRVIVADPDDDEVIAAAIAASADIIVSGDRHLLALGIYKGIRIITPAEAVTLIARDDSI
jgi:uncharacterized protein